MITGWFSTAFAAAYHCYTDVYLDVPEKNSRELEALDRDYRIFVNNPLISIFTPRDSQTITQDIAINIPLEKTLNTLATNQFTNFFFNHKRNKKECEAEIKDQSQIIIDVDNDNSYIVPASHKYKWV